MPPSKNFGWAIASLLLFWQLCIPAFINASKVSDLWSAGRYEESMKASADAKKYGRIGVIIGAVFAVVYLGITILGAVLATSQS